MHFYLLQQAVMSHPSSWPGFLIYFLGWAVILSVVFDNDETLLRKVTNFLYRRCFNPPLIRR